MSRTSRPLLLSPNDGLAISVVAAMVGIIPVAIALMNGEAFGAEETVALVLLVLGLIGIAVSAWHR